MGTATRSSAIDSLSPDELCVVAGAFDEAVANLGRDWPDEAIELLAGHVIELALSGERNPVRLRDSALAQVRATCGAPATTLSVTA